MKVFESSLPWYRVTVEYIRPANQVMVYEYAAHRGGWKLNSTDVFSADNPVDAIDAAIKQAIDLVTQSLERTQAEAKSPAEALRVFLGGRG